ncbi:hypothetical protein [Vibrio cholerae]|uniref:hypothetical protein n=4 Tax=Vibrio cholerae TaxID=666 RepID=UPI002270E7CD|nr:hypothetical protein [Vibrio cholerae]
MFFDDGNYEFARTFKSVVYASHVEFFKDQLLMASVMRSKKRLDAETLSALRLAEDRFQRHIDAGGSDFLIKGEPFEPQIWRASLAPSLEQEKRFSLLE